MTSSALVVGLFLLAGTSENPNGGAASVQVTQTAQTDRAELRSNDALLVMETVKGKAGVAIRESTPDKFWPFQKGDTVRRVDGRAVSQVNDLLYVWRQGAGSTFEFEVLRNNQSVTFKAGPKDFPGLALPATPEPPAPPPPPARTP